MSEQQAKLNDAERAEKLDLAMIELRHLATLPDTDNELAKSVFAFLFAAIIASENGYDETA
jgi:hypothetical protein